MHTGSRIPTTSISYYTFLGLGVGLGHSQGMAWEGNTSKEKACKKNNGRNGMARQGK